MITKPFVPPPEPKRVIVAPVQAPAAELPPIHDEPAPTQEQEPVREAVEQPREQPAAPVAPGRKSPSISDQVLLETTDRPASQVNLLIASYLAAHFSRKGNAWRILDLDGNLLLELQQDKTLRGYSAHIEHYQSIERILRAEYLDAHIDAFNAAMAFLEGPARKVEIIKEISSLLDKAKNFRDQA